MAGTKSDGEELFLALPGSYWASVFKNMMLDKSQFNAIYFTVFAAKMNEYAVGNCANRACYAAIKLFDLFKQTTWKISLVSNSKKDHFVLYLHDSSKQGKERKYYVYDPLTNPKVLFEFEDYIKLILPLFKEKRSNSTTKMPDFKFLVSNKTRVFFENNYNDIIKFIDELLPDIKSKNSMKRK